MRWKCVHCGQGVAAATESAVENDGWKIVALIEELVSARPALCPECQKGATPSRSRSSADLARSGFDVTPTRDR